MEGLKSCSSSIHCVMIEQGLALAWAPAPSPVDGEKTKKNKNGNRFGQLGRTNDESTPLPLSVNGKPVVGVVAAAAGGGKDGGHTVIVDDTGSIFTCGCDRWQQLGLGAAQGGAAGYTWANGRIWQNTLQRLAAFDASQTTFRDVAAGADHTLALASDGSVYGWGRSSLGQVVGGKHGPFLTAPVKIPNINAKAVAAVMDCSAVLDSDNLVVSFGRCSDTQLSALGACLARKNSTR